MDGGTIVYGTLGVVALLAAGLVMGLLRLFGVPFKRSAKWIGGAAALLVAPFALMAVILVGMGLLFIYLLVLLLPHAEPDAEESQSFAKTTWNGLVYDWDGETLLTRSQAWIGGWRRT